MVARRLAARVPATACSSFTTALLQRGPGDIYSMAADGTDVRTLVTDGGLDAAPAWSPDGTKIAFASTRRTRNCEPFGTFSCQSDIYEMNSDGSGPRVVAFFGHAPDWQSLNLPPDCSAGTATRRRCGRRTASSCNVSLSVPDPDGDRVAVSVTGVTQDEPTGGAPDAAAGTAPNQVRLRAERDSHGDGRVYMISFDVSDGRGGTCSGRRRSACRRAPAQPSTARRRATTRSRPDPGAVAQ